MTPCWHQPFKLQSFWHVQNRCTEAVPNRSENLFKLVGGGDVLGVQLGLWGNCAMLVKQGRQTDILKAWFWTAIADSVRIKATMLTHPFR
jgi:hypothetical protein